MTSRSVRRVGATVGGCLIALAMWSGLGRSIGAAPPPPDPEACLPTCEDDDGKFLVVAGNDPTTLAAQTIVVGLRFTEFAGLANFALFDADRDATNWDVPFEDGDGDPLNNPAAPQFVLTIFNDPNGTGGTGNAVARFTPGPDPLDPLCPAPTCEKGGWETIFPAGNNAWNGLSFAQQPDAFNADGDYYQYAFHFSAFDPAADQGWNAFKIRAFGTPLIVGKQVVGFLGAMGFNDIPTIYPNLDLSDGLSPADVAGSTYDGVWTFQTNLPPFLQQVTLFDGDMDFGNATCTYNDTNDPDSSGIPLFAAGTAAVAEGIAQATGPPASSACDGVDPLNGIRTGLPPEDNTNILVVRTPVPLVPAGISYQLKAPGSPSYLGGQVFVNQNPSGNKEWEQFRIQLVAPGDFPLGPCPAAGYPADVVKGYLASDCRTDELPGGAWEVQLRGMDVANLNFFFFDFDFQPPDPNIYSIGRLVWYDADSDGVQDLCAGVPCAPELGIEGVAYEVYDGPLPGANLIRSGVTNAIGEFSETLLPAGSYTVLITAPNFGAGQPLEGLHSTTGGETQDGIEVGLPECTDVGVPDFCGEPAYDEALFGYVAGESRGVMAPTSETCQDFADESIAELSTVFYSLTGANKIHNSVAPGVFFYFTEVTVGAGQTLSVQQSHTGSGPQFLLNNDEARVYTLNCGNVSSSNTTNSQTGTVTFGPLPAGTYILRLKYSAKSIVGKPAPIPSTIHYTFVAALDGIADPLTANDPALALTKK